MHLIFRILERILLELQGDCQVSVSLRFGMIEPSAMVFRVVWSDGYQYVKVLTIEEMKYTTPTSWLIESAKRAREENVKDG